MPTSRCHKNDCRSSSESYTSDSNKCIEDKNKKLKEQPNKKSSKYTEDKHKNQAKYTEDQINNLILNMNKCIHYVKKSDKKLEMNLEKINKKFKVVKSNCVNYETTVNRLRKEKHLMVNGSDAYGMFFSYCPQVIEPNNKIVF